jgi:hypothetical protein
MQGQLKEIIPTTFFQVNGPFYQFAFVLEANPFKKLLNRR